jgi:hypothetical protein
LVFSFIKLGRGFPHSAFTTPVVAILIGFFGYSAPISFNVQHAHFLKLLLIRLFGSFAVLDEVSFFFIPSILEQKDFFLAPPSGWGAFNPGFPGFAAL